MIFPAGTLWGTNHAKMAQNVEDAATKMRSIEGIRDRDRSAILKAIQVLSLPDGHKAYFFVMGVGPGGQVGGAFSYEQSYDLLVTEGFDAEDDMPIAKKITNPVNPTNDLPTVFLKIRASLAAQ